MRRPVVTNRKPIRREFMPERLLTGRVALVRFCCRMLFMVFAVTALFGASRAALAQVFDGNPPLSEQQAQQEARALDRAERAQRNDLLARMPWVAPGLRLPDESGVFALDRVAGTPQLLHLMEANGDLNQEPYDGVHPVKMDRLHGLRAIVSMPGNEAQIALHTLRPVFYLRLPAGPSVVAEDALVVKTTAVADQPKAVDENPHMEQYFLVPLVSTGEQRRLLALQLRDLGPRPMAQNLLPGPAIPLRAQPVSGGCWLRLDTPWPVAAGQYALVERLSPEWVNTDVWAIGINPAAPANPNPILPVKSEP